MKNTTEKILFLGVDSTTKYAVEYAKSIGAYTIITDYNTPEKVPAKLLSDEYWMINVGDVDILEKKCREEEITSVFAGCHEFCLDMAKELTKRLGFPFYSNEESWKISRDKNLFKKYCAECGIDTPHRYNLDENFDSAVLAEIHYPVITKPSDASSQRGFSICRNEDELRRGYNFALEFSGNKNIIVEEYVQGDEHDIVYYIEDCIPHIICMNDRLSSIVNDRPNETFVPNHSVLFDDFTKKLTDSIQKYVQAIDYKNGVLFFQAIHRDGVYYFLEMGGRIDGIGIWTLINPEFNFNYVHCMVDIARGKKPVIDWSLTDFSISGKYSANYLFWSKPGHISKIEGIDDIHSKNWVHMVVERFHEGDIVPKSDNMTQIAYDMGIVGDSLEDLISKLRYLNENLRILDDSGNNMLIPYDDYDYLRKMY